VPVDQHRSAGERMRARPVDGDLAVRPEDRRTADGAAETTTAARLVNEGLGPDREAGARCAPGPGRGVT